MLDLTRIGDYEVRDATALAGLVRYQATHIVLPRRAIIEAAHPAAPRAIAIRVLKHACILEALRHPGVPRVFECGMIDGRPWVAFEPPIGVSLAAELRTRRLAVDEVLDVIEEVATILTHAHARGVLHRNVTPSTILRDPRTRTIHLHGWSDACTLDSELPTPLKASARFLAPELLAGGTTDGRADVFALGVIAHHALSGCDAVVPVRAEDVPVDPPELAALIADMLADVPALRPTAAEVIDTVRSIRRTPRAPVLLEPVRKPRWTPQWGLEGQAAVARGVVEITPRRLRATSEDGEA